MTVSSTTNKAVFSGNGVTTVFSYNFQINSAADVVAIYTDATGVSTTLTSSQYSISGLLSPTGGTITYPLVGSPIAAGTTLTLARVLALTQPTSISNQGSFYPQVVESAIDRAVMEVQQVYEQIGRTITAPITDAVAMTALPTAAQRASKALTFDASGNPTAGVIPASGVISAPMAPVVGAASLAAGRTALGLGGLAVEGMGKGLQDDGAGNARVNFITESKSVNYAILATDHSERYMIVGPVTFTLPATSTLWNGFEFMVDVYGGTLTITPNAADAIEHNATGASTYVPVGGKAYITTDGGGNWYVRRVRTNQSAVQPGGYLTLLSGTPLPFSDVVSATTLYYTPDAHGLLPVFNGSEWIEFPFSELSCALNAAQQLASSAHDCYGIVVNGVPTLAIGPAWRQPGFGGGFGGVTSATNATPIVVTATGHNLVNGDIVYCTGFAGNTGANGAFTVSGVAGNAFTLTGSVGNGAYTAGSGTFSSRGAGAGSAAIVKQGGIYTNAVSMTMYNGVTPYTVPAGYGTYLGTIFIDSVAGQVTCYRSAGQNRKWGVWNAYNKRNIVLRSTDPTASWSYGSVYRPSNNNTANAAIVLTGLPDEPISCSFAQLVASGASTSRSSIGFTSTASSNGLVGYVILSNTMHSISRYEAPPSIGAQGVVPIEFGLAAATFYGGETLMLLTASYRG